MNPRLWIVVVLLAASCAAPQPPEAWSVERVSPIEEIAPEITICKEIRDFALGNHIASLEDSLAEAARIGAVAGASAALPMLSEFDELASDTTLSDADRAVKQHDLLVAASRSIDDATSATCDIPAFSAMYAASGFPSCYFELEIPIAAYTVVSPDGVCEPDDGPAFLPCWSNDGNHLAVDCVTKLIVQADGERWVPAGEPREVVFDRTGATAAPTVLRPKATSACIDLGLLFTGGSLAGGAAPDFERLAQAATSLNTATKALVDEFIAASTTALSLNEFEALASELDEATADSCGLPIVSAWVSITETVDSLPCWNRTGVAYPAYETADCTA